MHGLLRKALSWTAIASLLLTAPGAGASQALAAEFAEGGPVRLTPRTAAPSLSAPAPGGLGAPVSALPAGGTALPPGAALAPVPGLAPAAAASAPGRAAAGAPSSGPAPAAAHGAASPSGAASVSAGASPAAAASPGRRASGGASPVAALTGGAEGARRAPGAGDAEKTTEALAAVFDGRSSTLPPGAHDYDDILAGVRDGRYRFAKLRAASGRLNYLLGFNEAQLAALRAEARRLGVGLAIYGSRVSGPRSRQKTLDPVLDRALALVADKRSASATYPAAEGVRIEKTHIKEFGMDDPRTSDLTVMLIDARRSPAQLEETARRLELRLQGLGVSFPVRVFAGFEGSAFRSLADFQAWGSAYLRKSLGGAPELSEARLKRAHSELYATINVARWPFARGDLVNGLLGAALLSGSFALTMGWHPVVAAAGFGFGLTGRHLARLRAWIANEPDDTFLTNALALACDAAIGIAVMALFINPLGGYGLALSRIAGASSLHTMSKGALRLFIDKTFSRGAMGAQRWGAALTLGLSFAQGLVTACVYQGRPWAAPLQFALALAGCALVFRQPLRRLFGRA
jgi:hypothetical protein